MLNTLYFYGIVILTASILRTYVTWQGTNIKLRDNDIDMSNHVEEYIIYMDTLVIYIYIYIYTVAIVIVHFLDAIKKIKMHGTCIKIIIHNLFFRW